jgi:LacI family transcriptional regulator
MFVRRLTLRDIAKSAECHVTTVSRALRDDPSIPEETKRKIKAIAKKLGYAPDPMVAALAVYRSRVRATRYQATIIWATNGFTRNGWNSSKTYDLYYQGALERAAEFGFKLEEFWLREPRLTWSRATRILAARNVAGIIVAPQPKSRLRVRLDWSKFCAVAMGYSTAWPRLHTITNDHYNSMVSTVREVRRHGYRRIGLVIARTDDERVNRGWSAGFLSQQQFWRAADQIPIMDDSGHFKKPFDDWFLRYKPDAIISHPLTFHRLQKSNYRVPDDVGFACYTLQDDPEIPSVKFAGLDENPKLTGATAVDLLIGMFHRSERGMPAVAQRVLIEGTWREGNTLRPCPGSGSNRFLKKVM